MKIADSSNLDVALALTQVNSLSWKPKSLTATQLCDLFTTNYNKLFGQFSDSPYPKPTKQLKALLEKLLIELKSKNPEKMADSIVLFINQFLKLTPFPKGNHFTLRQSLVMLTQYLKEKGDIPAALDFRTADYETMQDNKKLKSWILKSLMKKVPEQNYSCIGDEFPVLPDSSITIEGYKFLTFENYLVTQDGGLLEAEYVIPDLERHIEHYGTVHGFTIHRSSINNYLFNDDSPLSELDGIAFTENVPLVCLSLDYLTGLHMQTELPILARYVAEHNISILELTRRHKVPLPNWEETAARIEKLSMYIKIVCNVFTKDLAPSKNPILFLSQGGIGSGKSSLLRYAKSKVDTGMLSASVDSARATSRFFQFYIKCHHHSDDYNALTLYASAVMGELTKRALENKFNYFRDATGIPYKGRYDGLLKLFKDNGFKTIVLSASAPLIVEKDRKDMDSSVFKRIMKRLAKKKRAIPWPIVISKHINHPISFFDAACDPNNEQTLLFDTMVKKGNTKLLAFVLNTTYGTIKHLKEAERISNFYLKYELMNIVSCDHIKSWIDASIASHIKILSYGHNKNSVLIVLDSVKFLDFLQKSSFNQDASCYTQLKYNKFPAHMPDVDYPFFQRKESSNFRLRQQVLGYDD